MLNNIGLVVHPKRPEALIVATELEEWGLEHKVGVKHLFEPRDSQGLDLVVSLGGDGTMLRAIDLSLLHQVPVMGVNFGHLGYLTETEPDELIPSLERFFKGDYEIEERMTLDIRVHKSSPGPANRFVAVNELVVEKSHSGHVVKLAVSIGGSHFLNYEADGLIVATPTGSTAYSFSSRGPVVSPMLEAMLLTPISPHMLFDRVMVLAPFEQVTIRVLDGPKATLMVDGLNKEILAIGESVTVGSSLLNARLAKFAERDFRNILKAKFGLNPLSPTDLSSGD